MPDTLQTALRERPSSQFALARPDGLCIDRRISAGADDHLLGFVDSSFDQSFVMKHGQFPGRVERAFMNDGGVPKAGAVVLSLAAHGMPGGIAKIRFGPFWRRKGLATDPETYRTMVQNLVRHYCVERGRMLTITPRPSPLAAATESACLEALGFRRRPNAGFPRYFVDLTLDSDAQMSSLGQKWRYNLRKSLRGNLEFREDSTLEGTRAFATLHAEMVARKRFGSSDRVDLVPAMLEQLPPGLKPRIFLVDKDGAPVAGAIVGEFGDTAYYIYGASGASALKSRAGYALQWGIVEALSRGRCLHYDLGGTSGDEGLRQFKDGLTGRAGHRAGFPDDFDYWAGPLGYVSGRAFYFARDLKHRLRR